MSRARYLAKRLAMTLPVLWAGMSMTWFAIYMGPIDPAASVLGSTQTQDPEAYEAAREQLGLDQAPLAHYQDWMWNMLTLDLGQTWLLYPGSSIDTLILQFLPRTLWLGVWAVIIAVFVGVPLGFYAGLHSNTLPDYVASLGGIVWRAMPNFWLAVMLLTLLVQSQNLIGINWDSLIVPVDAITGNPDLRNLHRPSNFLAATKKILPASVVLGSAAMGNEMRIGRTAVLETKQSKYVDLARAKGVPDRVLVWKHIFRNALVPLVPLVTNEAFLLIGGSVLVETVFGIQGMGFLFFRAAIQGDLPLIGALMFIFIVVMLAINILQDILYTIIDPRVGYEGN